MLLGLAEQQQLVSQQLLKPVFILYLFGNKMFWLRLKIHNCPNCIWFYAKIPAFECKSVFIQLGVKETQSLLTDSILSFLNSLFIRAGVC